MFRRRSRTPHLSGDVRPCPPRTGHGPGFLNRSLAVVSAAAVIGAGLAAAGAVTAGAVTAGDVAGNLVANSGFENGLSGWTCSGGSGATVTSPVRSGAAALKATPTGQDNAQCTQTVSVQPNSQ